MFIINVAVTAKGVKKVEKGGFLRDAKHIKKGGKLVVPPRFAALRPFTG